MTANPPPPPTPAPSRPFRFTREQYHDMGRRGYFDGKRVELIFGEVREMSTINWPHALAVAFPTGHWLNIQQPLVSPDSEPQPDVAVIPGSPRSYTDHPTVAALVVEVSDSTLNDDLTTKAELYATAGVAEYWVLDLNGRQLHVFRDPAPLPLPTELAATASSTHSTLGPTDTVSPLAAPHTSITVSDLLP
jgi:Uma2 family endonuclease